ERIAEELRRCVLRAGMDEIAQPMLRDEVAPGSTTAGKIKVEMELIGDRPAGKLADDAAVLGVVRAVDAHLGIRSSPRVASTDANIPLSLGLEATTLGSGGSSGGAHTLNEWYDPRGRDLALKRILLVLLTLAGAPSSQE